jgi:serine/threonine protein kinase
VVEQANQFNGPPRKGTYAVVTVRFTRTEGKSSDLWSDMEASLVVRGQTFPESDEACCLPDAWDAIGKIPTGGSGVGRIAFDVPRAGLDGAVLFLVITDPSGFDEAEGFFLAQPDQRRGGPDAPWRCSSAYCGRLTASAGAHRGAATHRWAAIAGGDRTMPRGSMAEDSRIGTSVGSYRLLSWIGRGGMSVVYLAVDLRTGNEVALKLLSPELAGNQVFRERFFRESRIALSIEHPNIVPVYEGGQDEGELYIAMRNIEGRHLGELIREEGRLELEQTATILGQVAGALDTAHQVGLVHRDVKPGNILLGSGDEVFLSDFGLTKEALSASGFTATGQMVGTVDYVAPEQIRGDPLDGRADVYSLGCVLFECLTGHVPFPRDREVATLWAHIREDAPTVTAEREDVPAGLDHVVARAMAKEPADRYPTAIALTDEFQSEVTAVGVRPRRRAFRTSKQRRRNRRAAIAIVAAVLTITGTVAYIATRPQPLVLPKANSLSLLDTEERRFVETSSVLGQPIALAVGQGTVWTINQGPVIQAAPGNPLRGSSLQRVDSTDLKANPVTVAVPDVALGLAFGEGSAWIITGVPTGITTAEPESTLYQMNPSTNQLTPWTNFPSDPQPTLVGSQLLVSQPIVTGGGFVWVAATDQDRILRFDPVTGDRVSVQLERGSSPVGLAVGEGEAAGIWTANNFTSTVSHIAFDGSLMDTYPIPSPPRAIAVGAGAVWITSGASKAVYRLDPAVFGSRGSSRTRSSTPGSR